MAVSESFAARLKSDSKEKRGEGRHFQWANIYVSIKLSTLIWAAECFFLFNNSHANVALYEIYSKEGTAYISLDFIALFRIQRNHLFSQH